MVVDRLAWAKLNNFPKVHDRNAIADILDNAQIVRDKDHRQGEIALQLLKQIEHLGLNGDIKGRDRLIGDDELGIAGEGPCNADALTLAAAELVWIALGMGAIEANPFEQIVHAGTALCGTPYTMDRERIGNNAPRCFAWIERGKGILKHDLHASAHCLELCAAHGPHILAIEQDTSSRGFKQTHDQTYRCTLSTATLANEPEGFAWLYRQIDTINGAQRASLGTKT
jgi:hypothetical protein